MFSPAPIKPVAPILANAAAFALSACGESKEDTALTQATFEASYGSVSCE